MGRSRNLADLLDANGDVKSGSLDNVPPSNDASALTTGTLSADRLAAGSIGAAKLAETYLKPDGDGSGLSGIASDALSSTFDVRTSTSLSPGKAVSFAGSDNTVGYYPSPASVTEGTTGNNSASAGSVFDRTGKIGLSASSPSAGNVRFYAVYEDANGAWQDGATYDYNVGYGYNHQSTGGDCFPLPGADRAFLLWAYSQGRTGYQGTESVQGRVRWAVATLSTTGTFSVGSWNDFTQSGSGDPPSLSVGFGSLMLDEDGGTFYATLYIINSSRYRWFKVTGTSLSSTSDNNSPLGFSGMYTSSRKFVKRSHRDSASNTLLTLNGYNDFQYRTCSWNGSDVKQGLSDTVIDYSPSLVSSKMAHTISHDGNYLVQLYSYGTQYYIRVLSTAYSGGSVTLTEESITALPPNLQAVFVPSSGSNVLFSITDTKWMIRGASGLTKLLTFEINDDGTITWAAAPASFPAAGNAFHQPTTADGGDTVKIIANGTPARTDTASIPVYGESDPFAYVGVSETSQTGSTASVITKGVASGFTGLIPGKRYYVSTDYDGSITTDTGSETPVGYALSSTELLVE